MSTLAPGGGRPRNQTRSFPFRPDALRQIIENLSGASDGLPKTPQAAYLAAHLERLGARTLVVEHHYIDRHFMEEVALYYSRCLVPRPNSCARIHAFAAVDGRDLDDENLSGLIRRAALEQEETERVAALLQDAYLGFIVVRPLPSVPIGRTVLDVLGDREHDSWIGVEYKVHFLGFELAIRGVAFQQQDRAVGACATTAVWTALQRLCRHEGDRTPTPSEITEAAVQHILSWGRPYPSPGLTIEQMCAALRRFDFPPIVFDTAESSESFPKDFKVRLNVYLRSGIPVILVLRSGMNSYHAVTAIGFRDEPALCQKDQVDGREVAIRNLDYSCLYVNDDRLGPYVPARIAVSEASAGDPVGEVLKSPHRAVALTIEWPGGEEELFVELAAAPLYPKLRTSAQDLFEQAFQLVPLAQESMDASRLGFEIFFERSGQYLSSLYRMPVDPSRIVGFQKTIALSRYVAVIRWFDEERPIFDTVWDTTDRIRDVGDMEQLLGLVSFDEITADRIDQLATALNSVAG